MTSEQSKDLESLIKELNDIKLRQKALEEREVLCKADILGALQAIGETKFASSYGSVTLQSRSSRLYGSEVTEAEAAYKRLKGLADDMGDYEQKPGKTSVVFRPLSEDAI